MVVVDLRFCLCRYLFPFLCCGRTRDLSAHSLVLRAAYTWFSVPATVRPPAYCFSISQVQSVETFLSGPIEVMRQRILRGTSAVSARQLALSGHRGTITHHDFLSVRKSPLHLIASLRSAHATSLPCPPHEQTCPSLHTIAAWHRAAPLCMRGPHLTRGYLPVLARCLLVVDSPTSTRSRQRSCR